jgi:hypothetical protein
LLGAVVAAGACDKVPIVDIAAGFTIADATWFAEEETLFFFYSVEAQQGLGSDSLIEVTFRTDDGEIPWTAISALQPVHTHVPVDCGPNTRCGGSSVKVVRTPRQIKIRLRYHRDGEVTLDPVVNVNIVGLGPPHTNRSLLVYGVFDATNSLVQWRARHQFPALRNEQVQELGLRRHFRVTDPAYGDLDPPFDANSYGYAFVPTCPPDLTALDWPRIETLERAVFDPNKVPDAASASHIVCAQATVTDAQGTFSTVAVARKNPEVNAAFPTLRSPIRTNTMIGYQLRPCTRTISESHRAMQVQRLQLENEPEVCIDDWQQPGFADQLASRFRARVDETRRAGTDMVITVALHHDEASGRLADVLEQALEQVLVVERDKSSPRVSGAFVFDSFGYAIVRSQLRQLALWCPAMGADDIDQFSDLLERDCALLPDIPNLRLGPFGVGNLPILPSRAQFLRFIDRYSEAQAGRMRELEFRAPERTPVSENIRVGDFGTATFFNNEIVTAGPRDVFSYCAENDASSVVFRSSTSPDPLPLAQLPNLHQIAPEASYPLGLFWEFPFLLRLRYEVVIAGSISAFSVTAPFGVSASARSYFGAELWQTGEFPLSDVLLLCTRFCDHPTFDSAGVYNVKAKFNETFLNQCYRPRFPAVGEGGFPRDP